MQLQPAEVNSRIELGKAVDKVFAGKDLPFWRNIYQLHYKPSATSVPITKWFYCDNGFQASMDLARRYCEHFDYRFLTLCPIFSDLEFEMLGEQSLSKVKEKK